MVGGSSLRSIGGFLLLTASKYHDEEEDDEQQHEKDLENERPVALDHVEQLEQLPLGRLDVRLAVETTRRQNAVEGEGDAREDAARTRRPCRRRSGR